ncbi:hypothetical protein J3A83DRAFT_4203464 [Scleroderma citrinum]
MWVLLCFCDMWVRGIANDVIMVLPLPLLSLFSGFYPVWACNVVVILQGVYMSRCGSATAVGRGMCHSSNGRCFVIVLLRLNVGRQHRCWAPMYMSYGWCAFVVVMPSRAMTDGVHQPLYTSPRHLVVSELEAQIGGRPVRPLPCQKTGKRSRGC